MKMNDECIQQTNITKEFIDNVVESVTIPLNHTEYQNYLTCFYKKQQFQMPDGTINFDNLQQFLEMFYGERDAQTVINSCNEVRGSNDGENAVLVANCIVKKLQKIEQEMEDNKTLTNSNNSKDDDLGEGTIDNVETNEI